MAKREKKNEDNSNENKDPQSRTQTIITIVSAIVTMTVALIGILPTLLRNAEEPSTPTVFAPTVTVIDSTNTAIPITPTLDITPTAVLDVFIEDFSKGSRC